MPGSAAALQLSPEQLSGWAVAESLSATSSTLTDAHLRELARRIATRTVLRRAHDLVGPIQPSRRVVREQLAEPFRGELDEEATLENLLGKEFPDPEDWVNIRREARRTEVVLMMDTSLSMSGKNLALAAVAAAVLAFSVKSEDLAVVAFESTAKALTHLGSRDPASRVVEEILTQPARGFTNISDGLAVGRRELARAETPAGSGFSSPTACSPPVRTRCRKQRSFPGCSCSSRRTTSWTRISAPGWRARAAGQWCG